MTGVQTCALPIWSSDTPLKEMQKHKADEAALPLFYSLAKRIFNKMRTARA